MKSSIHYFHVNTKIKIFEKYKNKYLMLVPNDENKDTLKKYEEMWSKIRDLIRSVTNN